mmetsp:Transcript_22825/g.63463  ORF Transcript_22825/g.63463 Transcript_22825/m.63463 type:complete len:93 (-) Transcript_22825:263-541(-)
MRSHLEGGLPSQKALSTCLQQPRHLPHAKRNQKGALTLESVRKVEYGGNCDIIQDLSTFSPTMGYPASLRPLPTLLSTPCDLAGCLGRVQSG